MTLEIKRGSTRSSGSVAQRNDKLEQSLSYKYESCCRASGVLELAIFGLDAQQLCR